MKVNLLICMTPLQALIAEKIIENDLDCKYDLIYITYYNKGKNKFYYDRISRNVRKSTFLYLDKSFFYFIIKSFALLRVYSFEYEDFYIATIHDKYCHFFASKIKYKNIKTYDDGFGNIYPYSPFYKKSHRSFIKSIIFKSMGVNKDIDDIKKKSFEHYTIYNDIPNIIKNTKYVNLFEDEVIASDTYKTKTVSFFLGQPLREKNKEYDDNFINHIVSSVNVDYYVPHPAEDYIISGDFEVINSHLIFEDFIIKKMENNEFSQVIVYGFFSTTLFNLKSYNNIRVISVYNSSILHEYSEIYDFIERNGIETLEVK